MANLHTEMTMGIKMAIAGVVFAALGLVACADVVDGDADTLAAHALETTVESELELRDQGQSTQATTCQQACAKAYIACGRAGGDPEECRGELQSCLLDCML